MWPRERRRVLPLQRRHGGRHAQTELLAVGPTEPPAMRTWHEPPAVSQPLDGAGGR